MNRRKFLVSAGSLGATAVAGCLSPGSGGREADSPSATGSPATGDRPSIQVALARRGAGAPTSTQLTVEPDGTLVYSIECGDASTERIEALETSRHRSFVDLVLGANVTEMDERYECRSDCPVDLPATRYEFTIDGETTSVYVEARAENVPEALGRIRDRLGAFRDEVGRPSCEDVVGTSTS